MSRRGPWLRADIIALVIGSAALLLTVGQLVAPPIHRYLTQPEMAITSPSANFVTPSKGFNVSGTARHIPPDNDLWLIIRHPDDFSYPVAQLDVVNGRWSVAAHKLCFLLGPGSQNLQVWMMPETSDGSLVTDFARSHVQAITELPPESVLETYVIVQVPSRTHVSC